MKRNLKLTMALAAGLCVCFTQCKKTSPASLQAAQKAKLKTSAITATPNVLFIVVDDLRWWTIHRLWENDTARQANNTMPITPHIDSLIDESVTFTNAHSAGVECCPSRTAFLTGLYPNETGIYNNKDTWQSGAGVDSTTTLFAQYAHNSNYLTYGAGKIFHCDPIGFYLHRPYLPTKQTYVGSGSTYATSAYNGYDFKIINTNYKDDSEGGTVSATDADTSNLTEDAKAVYFCIKRMKDAKAYNAAHPTAQKSFFVACGIRRPHAKLIAPAYYYNLYADGNIKTPQVVPSSLSALPQPAQDLAAEHQPSPSSDVMIASHNTDWVHYLKAYMACASYVDYQVGRLMSYIRNPANGIDGNTIVVLVSDHGFHLGEKHRIKKSTLWEETTRVPMIWRVPGVNAGAKCSTAVDLMALYPTLKAYCGLGGSPHGINIKPLIDNPTATGNYYALSVTGNAGTAGNFRPMASVRIGQDRLSQYKQDSTLEELYDHSTDPWEGNNLTTKPGWSVTLRGKLPTTFHSEYSGVACDGDDD